MAEKARICVVAYDLNHHMSFALSLFLLIRGTYNTAKSIYSLKVFEAGFDLTHWPILQESLMLTLFAIMLT